MKRNPNKCGQYCEDHDAINPVLALLTAAYLVGVVVHLASRLCGS
jgi:hypothetical protein